MIALLEIAVIGLNKCSLFLKAMIK